MHYLAYIYAVFFVGRAAFEFRDLCRSGYPRWLLGIEVLSKVLVFAGITFYITRGGTDGQARLLWSYAIVPIIGLEVMLRIFAIRHEEQDLDLSEATNRATDKVAVAITALVLCPAAYMGFRFAYPEPSGLACAVLGVAVAVGFGLAFCWPKLAGCFKSVSERKIAEWLRSNAPFNRSPDEIELLDNSMQGWPGFEESVRCQLFRIRYGDDLYVGLTGPATHCLATPITKDCSISERYDAYRSWFADYASRLLLLRAAKNFPEDFQQLVRDALSKPPNTDEPQCPRAANQPGG
jgi:hypothetical protein